MFPPSNGVACEQGKRKSRMTNLNAQFLYSESSMQGGKIFRSILGWCVFPRLLIFFPTFLGTYCQTKELQVIIISECAFFQKRCGNICKIVSFFAMFISVCWAVCEIYIS